MNMLVEQRVAGDLVVAQLALRERLFGIHQLDAARTVRGGHVPDGGVEPLVGPELQRIPISRQDKMFARLLETFTGKVTSRQPKVQLRKVVIQPESVEVMLDRFVVTPVGFRGNPL